MRARLAVLASGGGSNLQAILDHFDMLGDRRAADVVLVASDRPDASALARARTRGIPTAIVRTKARPEERPLLDILRDARVDYVALAGYLRLVPADVVRAWAGRIVNVHPALLPEFGGAGMYGHHVHEAVIAAGAGESGPTVHFVDEAFDRGAVIAQYAVPVRPGDTPEALAARVLRVEHLLYPRVVQALAAGRIHPGQPPRTGRTARDLTRETDVAPIVQEIEHALES
ncbi:MAG: phosphoribosylglycinamide formyltransferase [Gemmatimonadota bacterium]|nr:phosphoribosylglycinamide formyltransferase [Gemmatimonadota bacterium]